MENIQGTRDINPARRDPYRLQFSETEEPGRRRKEKMRKYHRKPQSTRKVYRLKRYRHEDFQPNIYADDLEEEYYGDEDHEREWEEEVEIYLLGKKKRLPGQFRGRRHLYRLNRIPDFKRGRKRLSEERNFIPAYDNEYYEESFNPNEYSEQRYRPGFEGGSGYPRLGNYGHYGERAPEFERGFQGTESQSPYASGYQVGPSYEGEHGYGSKEDLGSGRESY